MKTLVLFTILLTSYLASASIRGYRVSDPRFGFGSLKNVLKDPRSNVNNDLQGLIDKIPRQKIQEIVEKYIASDAEVKKDWDWVTSDDFEQKLRAIENSPEFGQVRKELESVSVDVPRFVNELHDIIGIGHISRNSGPYSGGLRALLDEVKPTIPMTEIKLYLVNKFIFSSAFRALVNKLKDANFKNEIATLQASAPVTDMLNAAKANGVDMAAINDFINGLVYYLDDFELMKN